MATLLELHALQWHRIGMRTDGAPGSPCINYASADDYAAAAVAGAVELPAKPTGRERSDLLAMFARYGWAAEAARLDEWPT